MAKQNKRNGRAAKVLRVAKADDRKERVIVDTDGTTRAPNARDRIAILDARLGKGVGAKRERAALQKRMERGE